MNSKRTTNIIVIGAGVGGLAAAIRLAAAGQRVTVLERNATVGGRANTLTVDGFRFDTGPTLLLMPDVYPELFAAAGRDIRDYVDLQPVQPNYRVNFDDGVSFDATTDHVALAAALDRIEPGAGARLAPFLKDAGYKYRVARERFINRNFLHPGQFLTPRNLVELARTGAVRNLFGALRATFHDERLRLAMSFQTMYLGISPLDAPAIYALLPYTELVEGIWYPRGGVYALIDALRRLATELGVALHTATDVTALTFAGPRVTGVTTADGHHVAADVVLCNGDLPYAYRALVPAGRRPDFSDRRLARLRYTASTYMLYVGVNRRYEQLEHHNVYLASDFRRNFDAIFRDYRLPERPSLYVNAPARTDPTCAPPGQDALYVLVPVPHLGWGTVDWQRDEPAYRQHVYARLEELGLTDLRKHIVAERVFTPADWHATYKLERGSAFGLGHDFLQVGYLRPANRAKRVPNLYFVGASTVPGTGVPLVMMGARLVTERILQEQT